MTQPGLDFFEKASAEEIEALKAEMIRNAVERNAQLPPDERLREEDVIAEEEWSFSLFGI